MNIANHVLNSWTYEMKYWTHQLWDEMIEKFCKNNIFKVIKRYVKKKKSITNIVKKKFEKKNNFQKKEVKFQQRLKS